jgi:signal transduction histidine kinase
MSGLLIFDEDGTEYQRLRQYIRANLLVTSSASVGVFLAYATVIHSGWILLESGIVAAVSLSLAQALFELKRRRTGRAVVIFVVANWSSSIITTAITPFVLPMITVTVLLPVVVLVPYLARRSLVAVMGGATSVAFLATLLARHSFVRGVQEVAPHWLIDAIMLAYVPTVVGLVGYCAWQNHLRIATQSTDLRASRARLVGATDSVRRQIERDLHDGAQQQLVAVAIRLGLLQRLATSNPETASSLASELSAELQTTITDLRNLAHGVYPALLHERGLGEALMAAALRASIPVRVEVRSDYRYPPDVEAAVYFTCLEAMQNCAKHAGAASMVIAISHDGGLRFSAEDNGRGFDTGTSHKGHGLTNMSDRIGAVGGRLTVTSEPGRGTTIAGFLPGFALRLGAGGEEN